MKHKETRKACPIRHHLVFVAQGAEAVPYVLDGCLDVRWVPIQLDFVAWPFVDCPSLVDVELRHVGPVEYVFETGLEASALVLEDVLDVLVVLDAHVMDETTTVSVGALACRRPCLQGRKTRGEDGRICLTNDTQLTTQG